MRYIILMMAKYKQKNNYIYRFYVIINDFFNSKNSLIYLLLIILAILPPTFSGSENLNLWNKIYQVLTNNFFYFIFFNTLGLCLFKFLIYNNKNYNFLLRYNDYKTYIENICIESVIVSIYLFILSLIIILSFSIFISFGDFKIISINILYKIFFHIVKCFITIPIISEIMVLLLLLLNKVMKFLIIVLNSVIFIIADTIKITHIYTAPLLYHYYLLDITFISPTMHLICFILEIYLMAFIIFILKRCLTRKKRDVL